MFFPVILIFFHFFTIRSSFSASHVNTTPPSSSTHISELILPMKTRIVRYIPDEQRRLMLSHSVESRLRLREFARGVGLTARQLRHLYVDGHMPVAIWQRFLKAMIPVPRVWITRASEKNWGHKPWTSVYEDLGRCLTCALIHFDTRLYTPLPPPFWQPRDPLPEHLYHK